MTRWPPTLLIVLGLAASVAAAAAAEPEPAPRDPLQPPAAARPATPAPAGPVTANAPAPAAVRQILVVDGRRHVVEGTRLRGVGDRLGEARIERIDDSAVWVRENGVLQRLPLYGSVTRRTVVADADSAAVLPTAASATPTTRSRRAALAQAPSNRTPVHSP